MNSHPSSLPHSPAIEAAGLPEASTPLGLLTAEPRQLVFDFLAEIELVAEVQEVIADATGRAESRPIPGPSPETAPLLARFRFLQHGHEEALACLVRERLLLADCAVPGTPKCRELVRLRLRAVFRALLGFGGEQSTRALRRCPVCGPDLENHRHFLVEWFGIRQTAEMLREVQAVLGHNAHAVHSYLSARES